MLYQRPDELRLIGIEVFPDEWSYEEEARQQLVVTARYENGLRRDVTHLADFATNEKELAEWRGWAGSSGFAERRGGGCGALLGRGGSGANHRADKPPVRGCAVYAGLPVNNFIDEKAHGRFQKLGILPSDLCSDSEFIRRAFIDVLGVLPEPAEVRRFLADEDTAKRDRLIDRLLDDPRYADTWANRWGDLFRPNIARGRT